MQEKTRAAYTQSKGKCSPVFTVYAFYNGLHLPTFDAREDKKINSIHIELHVKIWHFKVTQWRRYKSQSEWKWED